MSTEAALAAAGDAPGFEEYLAEIEWDFLVGILARNIAAQRPSKPDVIDALQHALREAREAYPPRQAPEESLRPTAPPAVLVPSAFIDLQPIEGGLLGRQWLATHNSGDKTRIRIESIDGELHGPLRGEGPTAVRDAVLGWMRGLPRGAAFLQNWAGAGVAQGRVQLYSFEPVGCQMRSLKHQMQESISREEPLPVARVAAWFSGVCRGLGELDKRGTLAGVQLAPTSVLADCSPRPGCVRLRDPGLLQLLHTDGPKQLSEADVCRALGGLLTAVLDYVPSAEDEGQRKNMRRIPGSDNAPPELRQLAVRLAAQPVAASELHGVVHACFDKVEKVHGRPGVTLAIPFPGDGFTFAQWSVSAEAREQLLQMISHTKRVVALDDHSTAELIDFASAAARSPDLTEITLHGPQLTAPALPTGGARVSELRRLRGVTAAASPTTSDGLAALEQDELGGGSQASAEAVQLARARKLAQVHAALFRPLGFQEARGGAMLDYEPREIPPGPRGAQYVEFRGVAGPRVFAYFDQFGIEHPETAIHCKQQNLLWAEFLKTAGAVHDPANADPPQQGAPVCSYSVDVAVWNAVGRALERSRSLRSCSVLRCSFSPSALHVFCGAATRSTSLSEVVLEHCGMCTPEHAAAAAMLIERSGPLRRLRLAHGSMTPDDCALLFGAARGNRSLEELEVVSFGIAAPAAIHIADLLNAAGSLRALRLGGNNLGEEGAMQLGELIAKHPSDVGWRRPLEELDLCGNSIGGQGCIAVIGALQRDAPLEWTFERCLHARRRPPQRPPSASAP
eukprot:TRINITY_DN49985_c0_g1_i1.p1 TRINITY_DN49985_c0_g1~~TRINITY_DN49985_c0_g1_i1.p1  ORF type:complete len:793 (+),score=273.51 TRINITY_DN49985_c0_g1_i1:73-2451(+)